MNVVKKSISLIGFGLILIPRMLLNSESILYPIVGLALVSSMLILDLIKSDFSLLKFEKFFLHTGLSIVLLDGYFSFPLDVLACTSGFVLGLVGVILNIKRSRSETQTVL